MMNLKAVILLAFWVLSSGSIVYGESPDGIRGFDDWEKSRLKPIVNRLATDKFGEGPFAADRRACKVAFDREDRIAFIDSIRVLVSRKDLNLHLHAVDMLRVLDRDPRVVPILQSLLRDESEYVFMPAAVLLQGSDTTSDAVLKLLDDAISDRDRIKYLRLLSRFGEIKIESVGKITRYLNDPNPRLRAMSAFTISTIAPDAAANVHSIIERLGLEEQREVRDSLYAALRRTGGQDHAAVDLLIQDATAKPSSECIRALGSVNVRVPEVAGLLVEIVRNSKNDEDRKWAIKSLGQLGHRSQPVVDALMDVFRDEKVIEDNRIYSIESLGKIRAGDLVQVDTLLTKFETGNLAVRQAIIEGLPDVAPKMVALPFLAEQGLVDDDTYVRAAAARSIAAYGDAAIKFVPLLEEHLEKERSLRVSVAVVRAIHTIQPEAEIRKKLTEFLQGIDRTENEGRVTTVEDMELEELIRAIYDFGDSSDELARLLVMFLDDRDDTIRQATILAIEKRGFASRAKIRKEFREMINDPSWKVSRAAFKVDRSLSEAEN